MVSIETLTEHKSTPGLLGDFWKASILCCCWLEASYVLTLRNQPPHCKLPYWLANYTAFCCDRSQSIQKKNKLWFSISVISLQGFGRNVSVKRTYCRIYDPVTVTIAIILWYRFRAPLSTGHKSKWCVGSGRAPPSSAITKGFEGFNPITKQKTLVSVH